MGIPFKMSVYKVDPKYFLFVIHMTNIKLINL